MARKYNVKITKSGFIYITITIIISVAAINTSNNLLYIISSLMLALMAISGMTSLYNLFFLHIRLDSSKEIFALTPSRFDLLIKKSLGSSFFLRCETDFGSIQMPFVKDNFKGTLWLSFPHRGRARLENLNIHSGFPLGFFRRYKKCPVELDVLVYPQPLQVQFLPPLSGSHGSERRSESFSGEVGDEIKELRDYRESDPFKWIEWKATARRRKMIVKEFYHLEGDTLVIDLSSKNDSWERRISEACYLILEGYRRKLAISLRLPDRVIKQNTGEKHRKILLEALALA